jgi:deazaflavin-dependent oxidoreductase (nitroreductase family)
MMGGETMGTETRVSLWARPRGALRLAFKLPIALYRLRLGWVVGQRFLQVMHQGRRSGRVYRTVLEVVRYDRASRESVVVAGFAHADWLRNIQATPAVEVRTGTDRYAPTQRFLEVDERFAVLTRFQREHPWEAPIMLRLFGLRPATDRREREEQWRALAAELPMVAFRPKG